MYKSLHRQRQRRRRCEKEKEGERVTNTHTTVSNGYHNFIFSSLPSPGRIDSSGKTVPRPRRIASFLRGASVRPRRSTLFPLVHCVIARWLTDKRRKEAAIPTTVSRGCFLDAAPRRGGEQYYISSRFRHPVSPSHHRSITVCLFAGATRSSPRSVDGNRKDGNTTGFAKQFRSWGG